MAFSYFDVNTLISKRHIQLGPDETFPAVFRAKKVCNCIFFILIFEVIKKKNFIHQNMLSTSQYVLKSPEYSLLFRSLSGLLNFHTCSSVWGAQNIWDSNKDL